jgi:ribulose-phosphate 3-epimerase
MATIIPAILESDPDFFEDRISQAVKIVGAERFQIDFADGKFTSYSTIALADTPVLNPEFEWEAHLMIEDPQSCFLDAQINGFNTVIFHYEAIQTPDLFESYSRDLRKMGMTVGLGLNPETSPEKILPYMDFFDQILVLGVHPGKQGQGILPGTLEKIKKIRTFSDKIKIEVDGGINQSNILEAVEAGADYIVVGSAIFKKLDGDDKSPSQKFEELSALLN